MHFNLATLWAQTSLPGKMVLILLILMGVYTLAISIERWFSLMRDRKRSSQIIDMFAALNLEKVNESTLETVKKEKFSTMRSVAFTLMKQHLEIGNNSNDPLSRLEEVEELERILERALVREGAFLKKGASGLATVASSAPFVGLLGTVIGIIHVFSTMKLTSSPNISMIAGGIGEALITTAIGLVVAIPAGVTFNVFSSKAEKAIMDLREVGGEILLNLARIKRQIVGNKK